MKQSGYMKRALKREPGYPVGIPAPMYLDCECGHHLPIPEIKGMPMTYQCLCGRVYDARGWIVSQTTNS